MTTFSKRKRAGFAAPGRRVSVSGIIITIQKVKHNASSLFFVIYAFVLLTLFPLLSICKSNHTPSLLQRLVLSGQKPRPTGNSLCKYNTVDIRRAVHGASLLWWDTPISVQIRTAIALLFFLFICCNCSLLSFKNPDILMFISYLQDHFPELTLSDWGAVVSKKTKRTTKKCRRSAAGLHL